ncbi:unnamed protein product, partial [Prorocentrum cordatum]
MGWISGGNFNPAVSLALGLSSTLGSRSCYFTWRSVFIYSCVQVLSGVCAAVAYSLLFWETFNLSPTPGTGWVNAGLCEMLYTFALCFVMLNVAASKRAPPAHDSPAPPSRAVLAHPQWPVNATPMASSGILTGVMLQETASQLCPRENVTIMQRAVVIVEATGIAEGAAKIQALAKRQTYQQTKLAAIHAQPKLNVHEKRFLCGDSTAKAFVLQCASPTNPALKLYEGHASQARGGGVSAPGRRAQAHEEPNQFYGLAIGLVVVAAGRLTLPFLSQSSPSGDGVAGCQAATAAPQFSWRVALGDVVGTAGVAARQSGTSAHACGSAGALRAGAVRPDAARPGTGLDPNGVLAISRGREGERDPPAGRMAEGRGRAAAGRLTGAEVLATAAGAIPGHGGLAARVPCIAVYGGVLLALHCRASAVAPQRGQGANYWGTLPSAWDHPEPNYAVSAAIGEFWSVLTTVPVAGSLLLRLGLKYGYSGRVLRIYAVVFVMYSLAFSAHLTLQKAVFSTTVISVMSNALLTFAEFSNVVHQVLHSVFVRGSIVFVAEAALISVVCTLPYALKANGGVWTLFIVQSPGVFLATALAAMLVRKSELAGSAAELEVFRLVRKAGALLSAAMLLSFVECSVGFEYGFLPRWWGFPWLHICIHVFEQVGIYIFGVGIAALDALLVGPPRAGVEVRHLGGWLVYCYRAHPDRHDEVEPAASLAGAGRGAVAELEKLERLGSLSSCSTEAGEPSEPHEPPLPATAVQQPLGGQPPAPGAYGAGSVTGGCFNPAVAVGIELSSIMLGFGWSLVYVFFELAGATLAALLFRAVRPGDFQQGCLSDSRDEIMPKLLSEFIGTYMLVLTVGLCVLASSPATALSVAASLSCMVYALGDVSGAHFNPSVTVAVLAIGQMRPEQAASYVLVQLAAGWEGACTTSVLAASSPGDWLRPMHLRVAHGATLYSCRASRGSAQQARRGALNSLLGAIRMRSVSQRAEPTRALPLRPPVALPVGHDAREGRADMSSGSCANALTGWRRKCSSLRDMCTSTGAVSPSGREHWA